MIILCQILLQSSIFILVCFVFLFVLLIFKYCKPVMSGIFNFSYSCHTCIVFFLVLVKVFVYIVIKRGVL